MRAHQVLPGRVLRQLAAAHPLGHPSAGGRAALERRGALPAQPVRPGRRGPGHYWWAVLSRPRSARGADAAFAHSCRTRPAAAAAAAAAAGWRQSGAAAAAALTSAQPRSLASRRALPARRGQRAASTATCVARPHQQPQRRRRSRAGAGAGVAAARGGHCAAGRAAARTKQQGARGAHPSDNCVQALPQHPAVGRGAGQRGGPLQQAPLRLLQEAAVTLPPFGGQ